MIYAEIVNESYEGGAGKNVNVYGGKEAEEFYDQHIEGFVCDTYKEIDWHPEEGECWDMLARNGFIPISETFFYKPDTENKPRPVPLASESIELSDLSLRTRCALINGGVTTIPQLQDTPMSHLRRLRGFGAKASSETTLFLKQLEQND